MFYRSPAPFLYHIFCWYQIASWSIHSCCFAEATTRIIGALLCLVRYLLFANLVHPATRCSTVSECCLHILYLPFSINPRASSHNLGSTIWSITVMIAAVFPGLRFWIITFLLLFFIQLTLLLFFPYLSILCLFIPFFSFSLSFYHAGFHPSSISSLSIRMLPSSNWTSTSSYSIVFIASSTMEFFPLVFSLLHAVLILLFSKQAIQQTTLSLVFL